MVVHGWHVPRFHYLSLTCVWLSLLTAPALSQQAGLPAGQSSAAASSTSRPSAAVPAPGTGPGARGGGVGADFTPLIDLIQTTLAPESWETTGEGTGTIVSFPGGVLVDAHQAVARSSTDPKLDSTRPAPAPPATALPSSGSASAQRPSAMRVVSLARLEAACQELADKGEPPTDDMLVLAGLERIDRVWIDAEGNDVWISGPASPWARTSRGWVVTESHRRPALRLEMLIEALRDVAIGGGRWICSINPRPEGLQEVQTVLTRYQSRPLKPGGRDDWLKSLRQAVGDQDVEFQGVDTDSRVAHVLLGADHHMKQIGIGLADGGPDVPSYLDLLRQEKTRPASMNVLRWWFSFAPQSVRCSTDRRVYQLNEHPAQVLSENQLLTEAGQRVPTGDSEPLNRKFAENFSRHLPELGRHYPIYAELENVYQFALLAAIIRQARSERLIDWSVRWWGDEQQCEIPRQAAPETVPSIVNARNVDRRTLVAGVSGGVMIDAAAEVRKAQPMANVKFASIGQSEGPADRSAWWWDVTVP
ncbi:MAG: DUF1598 domain-containing protein [Pirellulales bacterium]